MLSLPGVYRPQADTLLLAEAVRQAAIPPQSSVLDIGSGSGALSVAAARSGAGAVLAVDVSRLAVLTTWFNAIVRGLPVRVRRGDALAPLLLARRGLILMVHSGLCGVDRTLHQLRGGGLKASVVARHTEPFGPVMRGRIGFLEDHGLIEQGSGTRNWW